MCSVSVHPRPTKMSTKDQEYPEATLVKEAGPQWAHVEIERLSRELRETTHEKIQAAEYGLAVLEEKQQLKQRYDELETEFETVRQELDHLKEVTGPRCNGKDECTTWVIVTSTRPVSSETIRT